MKLRDKRAGKTRRVEAAGEASATKRKRRERKKERKEDNKDDEKREGKRKERQGVESSRGRISMNSEEESGDEDFLFSDIDSDEETSLNYIGDSDNEYADGTDSGQKVRKEKSY